MTSHGVKRHFANYCGRFLSLAFLGVVALSSGIANSAIPNGYDISKSWFQPKVSINNNAPVCAELLNQYATPFKKETQNILYADLENKRGVGSRPSTKGELVASKWKDFPTEKDNLKISEFRVNANYFAVVRRNYSIGWREGYHDEIMITKPFSQYHLKGEAIEKYFKEKSFGTLFKTDSQNSYRPVHEGDKELKEPKSLLFGRLVNIYNGNGDTYLLLEQQYAFVLFRVEGERSLTLQCELTSIPTKSDIESQVAIMPNLAGLRQTLLEMMGTECNGGTLHALSNAESSLIDSFNLITYRPWFLVAPEGGQSGFKRSTRKQIEINLNIWGHSGVWEFTKYQKYRKYVGPAEAELGAYYAKNFSLEIKDARRLAQLAISTALVNGFDHGQISDALSELHEKVLNGIAVPSDFNDVDIRKTTEIADADGADSSEALITFAIKQKKTLAMLLKMRANPNTKNWFGKTPLMYAAQFDQLESAKLLLANGAQTEAFTLGAVYSCISTTHLTPLHYAMKYSSMNFIKLLLKYGAPLYAKDSNGKTPYDYLNLNTNKFLKQVDIDELRISLTPPNDVQMKSLSVSKNREAERLYQQGKFDQAYWALERALMLDEENEPALSNKALISMKLGRYGDSAKASTRLITTTKSPDIKANAYFNLGLACQKSKALTIEFDGQTFCEVGRWGAESTRIDSSIVSNFLSSYEAKPNADRLNTVLSQFDADKKLNFGRICNLSNSNSGIKTVVFNPMHWYFLTDSKVTVPFEKLSGLFSNGESFFTVKSKKSFELNDALRVERWRVDQDFCSPIYLDSMVCVPSLLNAYERNAKLVAVFPASTRENDDPKSLLASKFKKLSISIADIYPVVIFLYGHNTEFVFDGNLKQVKAIFVHGNSLVTLPNDVDIEVSRDGENSSLSTVVDFPKPMNYHIRNRAGQDIYSIVNVGNKESIVLTESLVNENRYSGATD